MKQPKNWSEYYELTRDKPPSPLLLEALNYVQNKRSAIDIGGGALKDTRYLLDQGFEVTVIDTEELMAKEAAKLGSSHLSYYITSFADFKFPTDTYDIASAMYSLPFTPPATLVTVMQHIRDSLVPGGIFCGQFFGKRDEWSGNKGMTFLTNTETKSLLSDMEMISFAEEEKDGTTANGSPKHWHIFNVIVRK